MQTLARLGLRKYDPIMLRLLTPADAPLYAALRREMLIEAPWAFAAVPDDDRGGDLAGVAASLASPGYAIAGVRDSQRLVSTAVLIRGKNPKRAHLSGVVSVYTHPSARRRGLARQMLTLLIATARNWTGVAGLLLSVSEKSPAAQALYKSLGFIPWGREPDAIRVGGASLAEIHMRLRL